MRRLAWAFPGLLLAVGLLLPPGSGGAEPCPNFTIEGFGRNATGGCGFPVVYVTNLNDSGPGSLRNALSSGNKIIKFAVSGEIALSSNIQTSASNVTIDGSDAPNGGIAIRSAANSPTDPNSQLILEGSNVIIRHIRFRMNNTGGTEGDCVQLGGTNVVFDHVSASWCGDGSIDVYGSDITVQWSILSENLGPGAMLVQYSGSRRITLHHNLYAKNPSQRDPALNGASAGEDQEVDLVNNVMYRANLDRPGVAEVAPWQGPIFVNVVGNFFKLLGDERQDKSIRLYGRFADSPASRVYFSGNVGRGRPTDSGSEAGIADMVDGGLTVTTTRFNYPAVTTTSAAQAYNDVLANAGATLPCRDGVDTRVINDVQNGTNSTIGGYPNLNQPCGGSTPTPPAPPWNLRIR